MAEIKVPVFPESIAEGTIATWHKKPGDVVEESDIVAEIETDKVMMEVPAGVSGVIGEIKKQEGDNVLSEEVIATLEEGAKSAKPEVKETKVEVKATASGKSVALNAPTFPESISEGTVATWHKRLGEAVTEGETVVEIETDKVMMEVPATSSGILTKIIKNEGDTVLSAEVVAEVAEGAVEEPSSPASVPESNAKQNDSLSPSVRRAVKADNIDVSGIQGTGKHGRITKQDLNAPQAPTPAKKAEAPVQMAAEFTGERPERRVRMTRLRQTIAKRLVDVQHTNAILTTFNEVDMKPVMDLRKQYKDLFQKTHDTKLGFMSFFLKAATEALKRYPEVNASIDGTDVVYHGYFDIGVAVGSDRGLVVPVIRNTDQKSFAKIEGDIVEKAIKARDGKLSLEEMQGGTFTITNGGTYGSMLSTPIINAPQSAILGMHNIIERPVVINGEIVVRPIMYLALSYDHRIIDGSVSVKFLKTIKELIEDPARMLLEV
ncbi:2-oxoglutarate dehydrogenase complex dihydrolipoyllysine-residue succinyltransferase [Fangia hongkongensis]|uniref:2-oxoglutarate dehydrogenase complex dihydrolipoyllysine-residue succinyltransferase n=1 Tax=Fangia hongkongensis TaxID=270495 RepID=UPI00036ED6DD|nr:2-oxoglutarate dehydrogenase complex dihydrolipoyllysine-residue succinyltransferase [Fangia hongkongensis]MBK2125719.1 2-oxoglutarate dehydrogenase complex dihydrolipoyllysine-residue succinyltransferase [Fangia hongkongensis]